MAMSSMAATAARFIFISMVMAFITYLRCMAYYRRLRTRHIKPGSLLRQFSLVVMRSQDTICVRCMAHYEALRQPMSNMIDMKPSAMQCRADKRHNYRHWATQGRRRHADI